MHVITDRIGYVDLHFRDTPGVIATGVLRHASGVTLVDPGPTPCLPVLRRALDAEGIALADVRAIMLTHIHLDHGGVTGTLVQQHPEIDVYVHERGARHLIDPTRLLQSAGRLYGARMGPLWGAVLPVPAERVRSLRGGDTLELSGRRFEVAYTPGHAFHHVSFYDRELGLAWVGDTAGIRTRGSRLVMPPTPPPDIDLERWDESLALFRAWSPDRLFITHFGVVDGVPAYLDDLALKLREVAAMVQRSLEQGSDDQAHFASFQQEMSGYLRRFMSEQDAMAYERAAPLLYNWQGLARYWRKRER